MRKLIPGFRYFKCERCWTEWKMQCRDHDTPSGATCMKCHHFETPYKSEPKPDWETDCGGNLIEGIDYE